LQGQNLALNVADKGFTISVYNRSYEKTEAAVSRAQKEGGKEPEVSGRKSPGRERDAPVQGTPFPPEGSPLTF